MNDAGLLAEAWPYEYEDPNCYVTSLFAVWSVDADNYYYYSYYAIISPNTMNTRRTLISFP